LNVGKRAFKLSFKILLAESYLLSMSNKRIEREIKHTARETKLDASQQSGAWHGPPGFPLELPLD